MDNRKIYRDLYRVCIILYILYHIAFPCSGDTIENVNVIDEGWVEGRVQRTGQFGMIPSNYIEKQWMGMGQESAPAVYVRRVDL